MIRERPLRDTSSMPREAIRRNVASKNDRLERGSVGRSRASVVDTSSGETDDEQSDDSPKQDVSYSEELLEEDEEVAAMNNKDDEQLPNASWSCEHCTFMNDAGTRVCSVCCKTPTAKVNLVRTPSSVSQAKKSSIQSSVSSKKPPPGRETKRKGMDKNNKEQISNKTLQSPSSDDYSANSARDYSETESMQNKLEKININNLEVEKKKPEAKPKGRTIRKISFWPGTKFTASFYRNK